MLPTFNRYYFCYCITYRQLIVFLSNTRKLQHLVVNFIAYGRIFAANTSLLLKLQIFGNIGSEEGLHSTGVGTNSAMWPFLEAPAAFLCVRAAEKRLFNPFLHRCRLDSYNYVQLPFLCLENTFSVLLFELMWRRNSTTCIFTKSFDVPKLLVIPYPNCCRWYFTLSYMLLVHSWK